MTIYSSKLGDMLKVRDRLAVVLLCCGCCGCFAPDKRVYERTAIEQQVTAVAIERALDGLQIEAAPIPTPVFLHTVSPAESEHDLVHSLLINRLADAGIAVAREETENIPILEAHVLFAGSDTQLRLLGIPIALPTVVPTALPDLSLWKTETQMGRARLGLTAWGSDGARLAEVEESEGEAYFTNFTILTFIGGFRWTDIEHFSEDKDPVE